MVEYLSSTQGSGLSLQYGVGWGGGREDPPQIESNLKATSIFEDPHFGFGFLISVE